MLTIKNWLRKISYRAFNTGQAHRLKLSGKRAELFVEGNDQVPIVTKKLDTLFFQPQVLTYSVKGFVYPEQVFGSYRNQPLNLNLKAWVNGQEVEQN